MDERFLVFMSFILKWEGEEFEDDKDDAGGATKFGIDQRSHPKLDIKNLTKADAIQIYWEEYLSSKASQLSDPARWVFFDSVVNMGNEEAVIILQHCLGLEKDGIWGKNTQVEVEHADPTAISYKLIDRRNEVYHIIASHRNNQKFLAGWLNRDEDLRSLIPQL